jgi:hypothetical protein
VGTVGVQAFYSFGDRRSHDLEQPLAVGRII